MTRVEGEILYVEGPVTLQTVPRLLQEAQAQLPLVACIDFSAATEVDSAAVALALEWQRQAELRSARVRMQNFPPAMQNLARLYGVSELLQSTS